MAKRKPSKAKVEKHDDPRIVAEVFRPLAERTTIEWWLAQLVPICLDRLRPFGAESFPYKLPKVWPAGTPDDKRKMAEDARAAIWEVVALEWQIKNGDAKSAALEALKLGANMTKMGIRLDEPFIERGKRAKDTEAKRARAFAEKSQSQSRNMKDCFDAVYKVRFSKKERAIAHVAHEFKCSSRQVYRVLKLTS